MRACVFSLIFVAVFYASAEEVEVVNVATDDNNNPIAPTVPDDVPSQTVEDETERNEQEILTKDEPIGFEEDKMASTNETESNEEVHNNNSVNKTIKMTKVTCKSRELGENDTAVVRIVNNTVILGVVVPETNITANECALVLFYAPWCHFSALAAPHYNALARLYPTFHVLAVNAIKYNSLNTRYGIVAVPTLLLFHNGRAVAKFNETVYSLDNYVNFLAKYTSSEPDGSVNVTSADFYGPLPSEPISEPDYVLWLAWSFVLACASFGFVKSSLCCRMVEIVRNNWREAEAQHDHGD